MGHSHYVMDLYYRRESDPDRFRREVLRIDGKDDEPAVEESLRVAAWRMPAHFVLRAIQNSTRTGERQVYDSREHASSEDFLPDSGPQAATIASPAEPAGG
jgi:hypothetical protein